MTLDSRRLFELLPAIYRVRDAEIGSRIPAAHGPLEALLAVLAEQFEVLDENIEQLYDDQFIETCAPWVVPYIGDLIGFRLLHGRAPGASTPRAEVAHTIALRRRKGTVAVLEQLARDVTGWEAHAVEYFRLLATTQYVNHRRLDNRVTPSLRDGAMLEAVRSPFDTIPRTLDVRHIASGRGRYNIPNLGIFLWRIGAHRLVRSPATADPGDATGLRFRFSPLGNDGPLYTRPDIEDEITHLAEPINVPAPIARRTLYRNLGRYYGAGRSLLVHFDGTPRAVTDVTVCDLSDDGSGWAHDAPAGKVAIDPELGRLAVAADVALPTALEVTYHYGAPGDLGGGEYPRDGTFESPDGGFLRVPTDHPTIQDALDALGGAGVVEITDNGRYREALAVEVTEDREIELRAAVGQRPMIELTAPMTVTGGPGASFVLSGVVVAGAALRVPAAANDLRRLRLVHTTFVPGVHLETDGSPSAPGQPSIEVHPRGVEVSMERSIVGPLRVHSGSAASLLDCILDAGAVGERAYGSTTGGGADPGGATEIEASTVIGRVACESLSASNSILLGPVRVVRRQEGCLRFSFAPPQSTTPRRYRCQPSAGAEGENFPRFTSLRYGAPGYCQLAARTPDTIRRGAEDESEMGVFHFLFEPQRESDLGTRLEEYLRVGLEAGIFYAS